jgi:hypothetical protein
MSLLVYAHPIGNRNRALSLHDAFDEAGFLELAHQARIDA